MKLLKFSSCLVIFCMLALTGFGQSEKVSIQEVGSGIYKLAYKSSGPGSVKISIFDKNDGLIFTETINHVPFVRPYNLAELNSSTFKIVVEDKDGKTEKKFSYSVKKVESTFDVSKFGNVKNKYLFSVENNELDQIMVRIMDSDGNVVHEQSFQVNGKFNIVFSLDNVKGNPKFEVTGSSGVVKTFTF